MRVTSALSLLSCALLAACAIDVSKEPTGPIGVGPVALAANGSDTGCQRLPKGAAPPDYAQCDKVSLDAIQTVASRKQAPFAVVLVQGWKPSVFDWLSYYREQGINCTTDGVKYSCYIIPFSVRGLPSKAYFGNDWPSSFVTDLGVDVWGASYESWRDVAENGGMLAHALGRKLSGYQGVVLLAHSMGGLVARSALQQATAKTASKILGLVTLATPHTGSPLADPSLLQGPCDAVKNLQQVFGPGVNTPGGSDLADGLGAYQGSKPLFAYAGDLIPAPILPLYYSVTFGCLTNLGHANSDAVVPVTSAHLVNTASINVARRTIVGYDHTEMLKGKRSPFTSDPLFQMVRSDIAALLDPVPAQLVFPVQPVGGAAGQPLTEVRVAFANRSGSILPTAAGTISIALSPNAAGATVSGTLTAPAVAGIASFRDLVVDKAGPGLTLVASASGLPDATSQPFDVGWPPGALDVSVTGLPAGTPAAVAVAGPNGYHASITSSGVTSLTNLTPGDYTIDASVVTAPGVSCVPTPTTQTTIVTSSTSIGAVVAYGCASVPVLPRRIALLEADSNINPTVPRLRIVSLASDGSDRRVEWDFMNTLCISVGGLAWSPDQAEIAFVSSLCGDAGNAGVLILDTRTGAMRGGFGRGALSTTWSPDGSMIAYDHVYQPPFSSGIPGGGYLFQVSALNLAPETQLTPAGFPGEVTPDFSPDGASLVFTCHDTSWSGVCRMPANGGAADTLLVGMYSFPRYSPDGRSILLSQSVPGGLETYVADANGGDLRFVAAGAGVNGNDWASNSTILLSTTSGLQLVAVPPVGGAPSAPVPLIGPPAGVAWWFPTWH
jgi:pimeloyl-ACP methyl ester carboxylesterase